MNRNRIADLIEIGIKGYAAGGMLNKDAYLSIADKIIAEEGKPKECKCLYESDCHGIEMIKSPSGKEWAIGGNNTKDRWIYCPWCGGSIEKQPQQPKAKEGKGLKMPFEDWQYEQPQQPKEEGKVDDDLFWYGLPEGAANQALVLIARLKERVDKLSKIQPQQPKLPENRLTNLDISTNYRDKEYWFMRSDFLGAFAYWAVAQSPYDTPDITPALKAFGEYVSNRIKDGIPEKFTYAELKEFINEKVFESIPEIEKLNHPKIGVGQTINFCSRYGKPKADYALIDLDALARNIFFMLCRESITQG